MNTHRGFRAIGRGLLKTEHGSILALVLMILLCGQPAGAADSSTNVTYRSIRLYEKGTPEGYATISGRFDWGSTPVADRAPTADANQNGVKNLLEFAFNMDPLASNGPLTLPPGTGTSGLPVLKAATPLRPEYVRRKNSSLTYTAKFSSDLINWMSATAEPTVTPIDANWERCVITDPAGAGEPKRFGKIEVAE